MNVIKQKIGQYYAIYQGDSTEVMKGLPDNSVHYSIFSPPFASLYTYSNSDRDLGNCRSRTEFYEHFKFIVSELARVIKPGRLCSFHCMDIPAMKERDGYIGLIDFPGELIRMFEAEGFIYHSKATIWKDPLIEATRTKALGLMHKQIEKDSAMCRNGLPDYLITMRRPGDNPEPVAHPGGFTDFIGENEPEGGTYSHNVWRRYASPVWMDIDQGKTLNRESAREENDERHICPLQLQVIERGITLYSNPGDIVFTPFLGIGSEVHEAIKLGRYGIGIELKGSYFDQAGLNCEAAEAERDMPTMFDLEGVV